MKNPGFLVNGTIVVLKPTENNKHNIIAVTVGRYSTVVEGFPEYIGLPIILDSPSGREVSEENVRKMMEILKRDFSNHLIIIASIHDFGYANKVIEIKETLMEDSEIVNR